MQDLDLDDLVLHSDLVHSESTLSDLIISTRVFIKYFYLDVLRTSLLLLVELPDIPRPPWSFATSLMRFGLLLLTTICLLLIYISLRT